MKEKDQMNGSDNTTNDDNTDDAFAVDNNAISEYG